MISCVVVHQHVATVCRGCVSPMCPRGPGKGAWLWVFVRGSRTEVATSLVALGSVAACCQGDACCLGHEPVPLDRLGLSSPTLLPSPILGDQKPEEHISWSAGLGAGVAVTRGTGISLRTPRLVSQSQQSEMGDPCYTLPGEHGDLLRRRSFLVHHSTSSKVSVAPCLSVFWTWTWPFLLCARTARMSCRRES